MSEGMGESATSFLDESEGATFEPGSAFTDVACDGGRCSCEGVIEWKAPCVLLDADKGATITCWACKELRL